MDAVSGRVGGGEGAWIGVGKWVGEAVEAGVM